MTRILPLSQNIPMRLRIAFTLGVVFAIAPHVSAAQPTWAKKAVAFPEQCGEYKPYKNEDCKPIRIDSPDGKAKVDVFYRSVTDEAGAHFLQAFLDVTAPVQGRREAALPPASHDNRRETKVRVSKQNNVRVVLTGAADASVFLVLAYAPTK